MEPIIRIGEFKKMMGEILDEGNTVSPRLKRLSENDRKTIQIISQNPYIHHVELAKQLGMTEKGSWRLLATLKKHRAITRVESKKGNYWEVLLK